MHCNTAQFSYDGDTKRFTAEASDIAPLRDFHWTPFVVGSGVEQGLVLRSVKTGIEVRYRIVAKDYDRSGEDVTAYILKPLREDLIKCPAADGTSIFLIND